MGTGGWAGVVVGGHPESLVSLPPVEGERHQGIHATTVTAAHPAICSFCQVAPV
jgi:hypothetical protein